MKKATIAAGAGLLLAVPGAALAETSAPAADAVEAVDPARLETARITVEHVFPPGTYARLMDKSLDLVTGSIMDSLTAMPVRELAALGGMSEDQLSELGEGTMEEIMAIHDPVYRERMERSMRVMMGEMGVLMGQFEPEIREGLSRAYARRFTADELDELNRFFATPTGGAYARDSMMLFMDPEIMESMQAFMPEVMKQMPAIIEKTEAATADLPPTRKYEDLTDEDRAKLAALLGIPKESLDEHGGWLEDDPE